MYISPSVQENNIGAGSYGTEEKMMQLIGDIVVQLLQYNHQEVYRNKASMTLAQAVADSNSKNVDIHFAIHSNAGGGKARGSEIFYLSEKGKKLALAVYKYIEPLTPTSDRGVKKHEHLYELNKTDAVAALIEVAFHDNPEDAAFIMNNIQQIGEGIAHGICDYFGVEFKLPQPPKVESGETEKLYRVQVGAFSKKENAEKLAAELKSKGYNTIIV